MKNKSMKFSTISYKSIRFCLKYTWLFWFGFAFLGGCFLTMYRKPIKRVIIIWKPKYLMSLMFWTLLLFLFYWMSYQSVRYLFFFTTKKVPHKHHFIIKTLSFFILFVFVFPFLLIQLSALIFKIQGIAHLHPGYLDRELSIVSIWVLAFGCFLVFYHENRMYGRVARKNRIALQIIEEKEAQLLTYRYAEDIEHSFMFIRKGDKGYRLKNNGTFIKDHRRLSEMKEMLDLSYWETTKGVYINKRNVVKLDVDRNKVYLSIDQRELLMQMLAKYTVLKDIHKSIKSEYGLLSLSPVMYKKIELDGE